MARRSDNPPKVKVPTPRPSVAVTPADLEKARARWRKHAPRRYWGLLDAVKKAAPPAKKKG